MMHDHRDYGDECVCDPLEVTVAKEILAKENIDHRDYGDECVCDPLEV
jgi:hypothetical protein